MEPIKITPESVFQRNDVDFLFTEIDEETVLMNVKDNGYIGLNPVATDIWKILTTEKSLLKVVEDLMQMYEVDAEQCEKDIKPILWGMVRRDMLKLV